MKDFKASILQDIVSYIFSESSSLMSSIALFKYSRTELLISTSTIPTEGVRISIKVVDVDTEEKYAVNICVISKEEVESTNVHIESIANIIENLINKYNK